MQRLSWCLAVILVLAGAVSWQAQAPKCQGQKKDMDNAQARMNAAWDAWRKALAEVGAAQEAERKALAALQAAAQNAADASMAVIVAARAADACHQRYGYTSKCASQEHAEIQARDTYRKAVVARATANDAFTKASNRVTAAERAEAGKYDTANRLEKSYHQYVDAYNACLRSKPVYQ